MRLTVRELLTQGHDTPATYSHFQGLPEIHLNFHFTDGETEAWGDEQQTEPHVGRVARGHLRPTRKSSGGSPWAYDPRTPGLEGSGDTLLVVCAWGLVCDRGAAAVCVETLPPQVLSGSEDRVVGGGGQPGPTLTKDD